MLKPYATTYGTLLNVSKIERALLSYINTVDLNELEYEYPSSGNVKTVFITGYNTEEQELAAWEHPIILETLKGVQVVLSDVRRYVKNGSTIAPRLDSIVRDQNSLGFIIIRTLLTKDFLNNDLGQHREIFKPATTAMGVWLSGMINTTIILDPVESFNVEIIASMYANTLYYDSRDVLTNLDIIIARVISSKHVYKFSKKDIKKICEEYYVTSSSDLEELITNIQRILPEEKSQFVTIDSLIGVMGNVWTGPGSSETPIIALENVPTFLAMLYSAVTNRSYQKSRIGQLLNKNNRVIDAKLISTHFTNYINDIKVA